MVQSLETPAEPQQTPQPPPEREAFSPGPITMKALLEAGVHFGHQTRRWNPRMKRYIFTQRNGIHIIDLQQTLGMINDAYRAMTQVAADGGFVLFVGTKRQAQEVVASEAERCGMWYVNQRWLGGTLTNFQTIRGRINHMIDLQQKRDQGYFRVLPKKEGVKLRDTLNRLEKYFHGLRDMRELPAAIFVIDIGKENICIAEAQRMGVKIFAIVDSDCDPEKVTNIIPGNDDAVRSIKLITNRMATAIMEGKAEREARLQAEREELGLDDLPSEDELDLDMDGEAVPADLDGLAEAMMFSAPAGDDAAEAGEGEDGPVAAAPEMTASGVDAALEAGETPDTEGVEPASEDGEG